MGVEELVEAFRAMDAANRVIVINGIAEFDEDGWAVDCDLSDEEKASITEAIAEYEANPTDVESWDVVYQRIKAGLERPGGAS
jgi:hypothetical protein